MSLRVLQFTATIPANTAKASPHTVDLSLDNWDIESIGLQVPPGPSYLMGFYIANNGRQWLPQGDGEWLVWDDHEATWSLTGQPNASGWQVVGYNTSVAYDHSVYVRFHVNAPTVTAPQVTPPVIVASAPLQTAGVIL